MFRAGLCHVVIKILSRGEAPRSLRYLNKWVRMFDSLLEEFYEWSTDYLASEGCDYVVVVNVHFHYVLVIGTPPVILIGMLVA